MATWGRPWVGFADFECVCGRAPGGEFRFENALCQPAQEEPPTTRWKKERVEAEFLSWSGLQIAEA